jgi:arsenite/tail-anchored protein-transporting ATPase
VRSRSFADASITDPVLRERGAREHPYLAEVREQLAQRVAWVPWYPEPPVGRTDLLEFVRGGTVPALAPMAS